jgi:hypothetical protein
LVSGPKLVLVRKHITRVSSFVKYWLPLKNRNYRTNLLRTDPWIFHFLSDSAPRPPLPPFLPLKVPKREIFVTELFILSDPIWVGDLRNEPKKPFV